MRGLCVRDRYRGPFLGIPDKDEEGSWIQAASVSGPERDPAVAWRRGRKAYVCCTQEHCIDRNYCFLWKTAEAEEVTFSSADTVSG